MCRKNLGWLLLVIIFTPSLVWAQYCPPTVVVKTWRACSDAKQEVCTIHYTHEYVPSGSCPPPPTFTPPPPSLPPPSNATLVAAQEKKEFCDTAPLEVATDVEDCQAKVDLMRVVQLESCKDHGTLNWSFNYTGARMETSTKQVFEYVSLLQCKGMVHSFAGYTGSSCSTQGNRARGRAVSVCGPIQW